MMSRINRLFTNQDKKLVCYITPEYPVSGLTAPLVLKLAGSGADMIEIGIPFSDPLADGPVIQHSSQQALESGVNLSSILENVRDIRRKSQVPIILMGYANSVLNEGVERFFAELNDAGVDGAILPDVPLEEMQRFSEPARQNDVDLIPLVTPLSSEKRIATLSRLGSGFVYCVSVTGVTGARDKFLNVETIDFLKRVRKNSILPALVGFGISKKVHLKFLEDHCDGFIIGSALIRELEKGKSVTACLKKAGAFMKELIG